MKRSLSRRDFLKLGGLALGSLALAPFDDDSRFEDGELIRVANDGVSVHVQPNDEYRIVATWPRDSILHVYETVVAETPGYNPVWYRVWGGYMHREHMQQVKVIYNQPLSTVPETGLLGEITVPYSQAYRTAYNGWQTTYRLYYETVHWVTGIDTGPDGGPWYRILDELDEAIYYVPAAHVRIIPEAELNPISPDVPHEHKRIEVSLATQTLTCFEYDTPVFETNVSSGRAGLNGPTGEPTSTPRGRFNVQVKMPSKHMGDADLAAEIDDYVLPGVPWVGFFTDRGHAFHGTYWHDNFGVPMSHGCINMRTAEAKWLFRWTLPAAPFDDIDRQTLDRKGFGTSIYID
ncbi:MAG: L,D-transpeptidase [Anaerolineales bacterium]|nr:L,D-transpeptidase [Anaerolineales bacterium]